MNRIIYQTQAVCIGAVTANELKSRGNIDAVLPEIQNSESIVELIKKLKG